MPSFRHVRRFSELSLADVAEVGGKNASLGELIRGLSKAGIRVPDGFATTAEAFRTVLKVNGIDDAIRARMAALDRSDLGALRETGRLVRGWIIEATLPEELVAEVTEAYRELGERYGTDPDVAVRSSATAEDLPDASFAGQQETLLNITGIDKVLQAIRQVFASLYTDRAIAYRADHGFDPLDIALSAGIQKMVRSDLASSGVMFTLDTESGFRDVVLINAAYGLGESVVQGSVTPDEFYVFKPTLTANYRPIIRRRLGHKAEKMIYAEPGLGDASTQVVAVAEADRERFSLSDDEVLELTRYAIAIEQHYSDHAGQSRPMDIEWGKDGESGHLFILQARPETVQSRQNRFVQESFTLSERGPILAEGKSIGTKVAAGTARIMTSLGNMDDLDAGDVLVTDMTDPDWEPIMKKAAAIVTNRGGRTCHAAIVARELGIPAVLGCGDATERVPDGQEVTVSCAEGDGGFVYQGRLAFERKAVDISALPKPRTKLMLNLANPDIAFETSRLPSEGVGLARLEFIINSTIKIHPEALRQFARLDAGLQARIRGMIAGYEGPEHFYVERLAEGIGTIAAAFYPRPVIVRLSDFKSNEYAALVGGAAFEPQEENPMLGFRGASRYPDPLFAESFRLECRALKTVRDVMGLTNVKIMIPFVRTVSEQLRVLELMAEEGLVRGADGLEVILMCEIPANALLADSFLEHCDGFSIGSNDLTQLTLGVDRDSGYLKGYDERNEAVKQLMRMAIEACHRHGKYIGICGQAPSDFPEITRWLVEQGIDSMSLNPDSVLAMTQVVLDTEGAQGLRGPTAVNEDSSQAEH